MSNKNQELNEEILEKVDVSPDMQFYNLLESYPYTLKGALCEYIDNSLEAYIKKTNIGERELPPKLKISIQIDESKIIIDDNGPGIGTDEIARAMKPAYKTQKQSLSEFGIGMKAASMWFGKKWTLESYPLGASSGDSFKIIFDLKKLLSTNSKSVDITPLNEPVKANGVRLILESLNVIIDDKQAKRACEEIQETYQLFTSRKEPKAILDIDFKFKGITLPRKNFEKLTVANQSLNFPVCKFKDATLYAIGKSVEWRKNIDFIFQEKRVRGFISLGRESSQVSNPGLRLFRFGRLIRGMESNHYRPVDLVGTANKAAPSRFYGELHLDGQAVSNSKGEFIFDEYLFIEALKEQEGVLDYIEQAEQYRSIKAENGDYISYLNEEEYEEKTGNAKSNKRGRNNSKGKKKKKTSKREDPIIVIEKLSAPSSFLLLDTFLDEAKLLYRQNKVWPFCLVYRVILEVSIIDKIKSIDEEHYDTAKSKSIVALYKYLQSNSTLIPDEYETLKRVLRETNRDKDPFVGVLNLASHGRYIPSMPEVQDLLRNTQQLIEWAFDRDE